MSRDLAYEFPPPAPDKEGSPSWQCGYLGNSLCWRVGEGGGGTLGEEGQLLKEGQELEGKFPLQMGSDSLLPSGQSEGASSHPWMEASLGETSCLLSSLEILPVGLKHPGIWVGALVLLLTCCVALCKFLSLSEPQCPLLESGDNNPRRTVLGPR